MSGIRCNHIALAIFFESDWSGGMGVLPQKILKIKCSESISRAFEAISKTQYVFKKLLFLLDDKIFSEKNPYAKPIIINY